MKIVVYEYVTGGGLLSAGIAPEQAGSLLVEGGAMAEALAEDLCAIAGAEVTVLRDARLGEFAVEGCRMEICASPCDDERSLDRLAPQSDWTIVIAPETGGILLAAASRVLAAGGRLLGGGTEFIETAGDKQRTAERLHRAGVPVPRSRLIPSGAPLPVDFPYPAVVKPRCGCGSEGVRRLDSAAEAQAVELADHDRRLERFVAGRAVSVSLLSGGGKLLPLPPCRQRLSADAGFNYLGGAAPAFIGSREAERLHGRATELALQAAGVLPASLGWVGVDLMLGGDDDGRDDCVIEVNPRLTTSYVGLRQLAAGNLAAAMIAAAGAKLDAAPAFDDRRRVTFHSDGSFSHAELTESHP